LRGEEKKKNKVKKKIALEETALKALFVGAGSPARKRRGIEKEKGGKFRLPQKKRKGKSGLLKEKQSCLFGLEGRAIRTRASARILRAVRGRSMKKSLRRDAFTSKKKNYPGRKKGGLRGGSWDESQDGCRISRGGGIGPAMAERREARSEEGFPSELADH